MKRLPILAIVMALALAAVGGCSRAKAKTTPDVPALDMPSPPPRDVEPVESEPPQPATLPAEPARTPIPRPRPPASTPARPEPARPEAPKPDVTPPATEAKTEDAPKSPSTTLQTTPSQAEGEVERMIRVTRQRATADHDRNDYRRLIADAQTQYDTAKSFVRQADAAIRAKNLVYAKTVADKAAALAAQLGGR